MHHLEESIMKKAHNARFDSLKMILNNTPNQLLIFCAYGKKAGTK